MNARTLIKLALAACLLGIFGSAGAGTPVVDEDIDLFLGATPPNAGCGCANVLMIIDNSSNWGSNSFVINDGTKNTPFYFEQQALDTVITNLGSSLQLGLMMSENGGSDSNYGLSNSSILGGVVRFAIRPMNSTNKTAFLNMVNGMDSSADAANPSTAFAMDMHTAYQYFTGATLFNSGGNKWYNASTGVSSVPTSVCTKKCSIYYTPNPGPYYPPYSSGGSSASPNADPSPGGQSRADNGTLRFGKSSGTISMGDSGAYVSGVTPHQFLSPVTTTCTRNYIIWITNSTASDLENGGTSSSGGQTQFSANDMLTYDGGNTTAIARGNDAIDGTPFVASGNFGAADSLMPNYAAFMYGTNMQPSITTPTNVTTYTVNIWPKSPQTSDYDMEIVDQITAAKGHGKYFRATSLNSLIQDLNQIFAEVDAVNSVFAAATLPVSANVRGTDLNQVYLGMFRPDATLLPRWYGNVKMYKLALDTSSGNVFLADANNTAAENSSTSFITPSAQSFWTTSSTFWGFRASSLNGLGGSSDAPDGDIVEKGAAAQQLRIAYASSQSTRNLYTCTGSCSGGSALSGTPFATSNTAITYTALGVPDATTAANVINWTRGQDLQDENQNSSTTDVRASIHGDVLHSRPAVVDYNRDGTNSGNDVFAFYGANDGVFHAIQGAFGTGAGQEAWGFIPSEFFSKLSTIYNNNTQLTLASKKPYFFDGSVGVYTLDANNDTKIVAADGDKVYLYLATHRGGNFVYALDASDPANPKFLWKATPTQLCNASGCTATTAYAEMGESWSTVQVAKINANSNPVVIWAAGYDNVTEDVDPVVGTDTVGRGIFVADAVTGQLLWQAGPNPSGATTNDTVAAMTHSIPSDITVYDSNRDGFADRLYVGDTGGNIWRVDINDANPVNWVVTKLASLDDTTTSGHRKFLFQPDVVFNNDSNGTFDAVLIGSGDREHPFNTTTTNRFYMIKDAHSLSETAGFTTITESNLYDATQNLVQVGTTTQKSAAASALLAASGWFVTLNTGEEVTGSSISAAGTTVFNTNQPSPPSSNVCTANLGIATQYALSFVNASATQSNTNSTTLTTADRSEVMQGGGLPPSPVLVVVNINGQYVQGVVTGTTVRTFTGTIGARARIYWKKKSP
ncbi:MAG: pilus assembly protein [Bacillota bacterium]